MTHDEFLSRLEGVKRQGSGHIARCPGHEDRRQSLGVNEGDDGRTLIRCYAGCTAEQVVGALGLEVKDLFESEPKATEPVAIYDYLDADGELVQQVLRMPEKSFRQRRPDGAGGWVWKMEGVERVPYRLPEVLEAIEAGRRVYIVEGEKDADAIVAAGSTATCNPGGAGKWQDAWAEKYFAGAHVFIITDLDEPGKLHARAVRDSLTPHAASVRVLRSSTGKDVYDHLKSGEKLEDLPRFELDEITDGLTLTMATELLYKDVEWVEGFKDFFPYSAISMLFGEPGTNKSTLTCMLASTVTRAGHGAIFLSAEDDPEIAYKPRLYAAGANLSKVGFLGKKAGGADANFSLPHDAAAMDTLVEKHGVRLFVIDTVDDALGLEIDAYKAQAVRHALMPLQGIAHRHKVCIVLVSHLNQNQSSSPINRAGGSRLTGVARACSVMGVDKDDSDNLRILAGFKNNWGPIPKSLLFRIGTSFVPDREETAVKLEGFGTSPATAKGVLYQPRGERTGE